jgi:hypothetical protein
MGQLQQKVGTVGIGVFPEALPDRHGDPSELIDT